jgi:hypothetical protein
LEAEVRIFQKLRKESAEIAGRIFLKIWKESYES